MKMFLNDNNDEMSDADDQKCREFSVAVGEMFVKGDFTEDLAGAALIDAIVVYFTNLSIVRSHPDTAGTLMAAFCASILQNIDIVKNTIKEHDAAKAGGVQ